jgi:ABC-type branched-subunit amino acid transport system ATPase component
MSTPASTLRTEALTKSYSGRTVVRGVSLDVNSGEVVGLLGPNGAGKSTTILTLAGELPALGGDILMRGERTTAPLHKRVQAGLGLVSEERTVLMRLTVAENLRVNRGDTDYALELFPELEPHLKRRVGMLSGGQQQMLALARALSRRPRLLLADELSLGLAPLVVARLLTAVRAAADERGIGVLLVEQHVKQALRVADRVLVMRSGSIVLQGTSAEVEGRLEEAYLSSGIAESPAPDQPAA